MGDKSGRVTVQMGCVWVRYSVPSERQTCEEIQSERVLNCQRSRARGLAPTRRQWSGGGSFGIRRRELKNARTMRAVQKKHDWKKKR